MKKVMIFGTFDTIHPGHYDFFKQAKKHGDYLVVVVARDETVKKVKGSFPKKNELTRIKEVEVAPNIDAVRMGYLNDPYRIILEEKPDVICFGYDQKVYTEKIELFLRKNGLHIDVIRLKAFKPEKYKSSLLK